MGILSMFFRKKKRESELIRKIRLYKELLEEKISKWEEINKKHPNFQEVKKSSSNIYQKVHRENKKFCDSICQRLDTIKKRDVKKHPKHAKKIREKTKKIIHNLKEAFILVKDEKHYKAAVKKLNFAIRGIQKYEEFISNLKS